MSLQLDERRLAMLDAMGIRLFQPHPHAGPHDSTPPEPSRQAGGKPAVAAGMVSNQPPTKASQARAEIELLQWDALADTVAACRACKLCEGRTNTVFGVGDRHANWLLVGEAPGENEDLQGEPFVGQAGKLLDNMLKALGLDRSSKVYIANVLKCRPPGNRNPQPEEVVQCEPFLRRQVQLLQPKIILAMGRFAAQTLLGTTEPIGKLRGRVHQYAGVPVVATYHPAYLLRNLPDKAKAWIDLCFAQELLRKNSR
jgi:uracil-DNA glycosylase